MSVILEWLTQQVLWISLICLFGALGYIAAATVAKRRRDTSQFSLEREIYHQRMARAWVVATLFLALAGTVFLVNIFWLPPVDANGSATPTPRSGLFTPTPGSRETALSATGSVTTAIVSTPASAGTAVPLPAATSVSADQLQPDCPSPGAQITFPVAGSDLSGTVDIVGTANVNAFSYYRYQVIFPGSDTPTFIAQYDQAVENGPLNRWVISDPARYPPGGPYRFQLVVVDIYGNTTTCTIPVNIVSSEE